MTGFDPSGVVVLAIVLAIGAVLLLTVFRERLSDRVRTALEKSLGIGYPMVVGIAFAALSLRAWQNGENNSTIGFAVGGVIMVLLAARAGRRGLGKR